MQNTAEQTNVELDKKISGIPGARGRGKNKTMIGGESNSGALNGPGRSADKDQSERKHISSAGLPRYTRRLSDKILVAFHHACDQKDFEVADQLLHTLEMMLTRQPLMPDGNKRRNMETLVAAYGRLWHLRHPQTDEF
jgi:hypothetical protein